MTRRARVLLVNPNVCKPHNARLPLSILALAAVLDQRHDYRMVDGNVDASPIATCLDLLSRERFDLVGISVMPGPQVVQAVQIASAIRRTYPAVPILWGGYFPTLYPEAAINAPYVDFLARGPGEDTLIELLERIGDAGRATPASSGRPSALEEIRGLTWKNDAVIVHNPERRPRPLAALPRLPYAALGDLTPYHNQSFLTGRTSVHEAATGCRYHCNFCGVVSMFDGKTSLDDPGRLEHHLTTLRDRHGVQSMMYYDNNFFDSEKTCQPTLEVLARVGMPYWCYGRADTLAGFSASTWELVRRSQLRMVYMGVESPDDEVLRRMRKGLRAGQALEAAVKCHEHGVIPELSFILGGPHGDNAGNAGNAGNGVNGVNGVNDAEEQIERTFTFVREVKRRVPTCEIVLYFYTPMPQRDRAALADGRPGPGVIPLQKYGPAGPAIPTTPDEWAQPDWVSYVSHTDAPWLTPRLRRKVNDFARVLACRFPTVQDTRTPAWGKQLLSGVARWRYATNIYARPVELAWLHSRLRLKVPQAEGL